MHRIRVIYFLAQSNWRVDSIICGIQLLFSLACEFHTTWLTGTVPIWCGEKHTKSRLKSKSSSTWWQVRPNVVHSAQKAHDRDDKWQTKVDAANIIYDKWYRKLTANLTANADYTNLSFVQSCELQITSSPSRTIYEGGAVNSERTQL